MDRAVTDRMARAAREFRHAVEQAANAYAAELRLLAHAATQTSASLAVLKPTRTGAAGESRSDMDVSSQQTAPAAEGLNEPPRPPAASCWTDDRKRLLIREYAKSTPISDIRMQLESLGGAPLPNNNAALSAYATSVLKVRRPWGFVVHPHRSDTVASAPAQAAPAAKPAKPLFFDEPIAGWPTPARVAVLKREFPQGTPIGAIRRMLGAIKGPALPANQLIVGYCISSLKLHRPEKPLSGAPRDGGPSVAASILAEDAARLGAAPVDWRAAMDWAERNKVTLGGTEEADLAATNQARRAAGLPAFRIVAMRGPPEGLPGVRLEMRA
jgi:hypothetical protein